MTKICNIEGCSYPVFSKMLCNNHWRAKYGKIKIKPYKISKFSKKRQVLAKTYTKQITVSNAIPNQRCWFCNEVITGRISNHHVLGKDGEKLIDSKDYKPCHNICHLDWHDKSVVVLSKRPWWNSFMERLKIEYPDIYLKTNNKFNK